MQPRQRITPTNSLQQYVRIGSDSAATGDVRAGRLRGSEAWSGLHWVPPAAPWQHPARYEKVDHTRNELREVSVAARPQRHGRGGGASFLAPPPDAVVRELDDEERRRVDRHLRARPCPGATRTRPATSSRRRHSHADAAKSVENGLRLLRVSLGGRAARKITGRYPRYKPRGPSAASTDRQAEK